MPIAVAVLYFPAKHAGISYEEMFYDQSRFVRAAAKFARDFDWDAVSLLRSFETVTLGLALAGSDPETAVNVAVASVLGGGAAHDILRDVYSSQPGRELPADAESQFAIRTPVMSDKEYDELIADPFGFLNAKVVPRVYAALAEPGSAWATAALVRLGQQIKQTLDEVGEFTRAMREADCPPWYLALTPNPLDALGAFLRNFDRVLVDLHRMPDKVERVCELLTPVLLAVGKATGDISAQLTGSRRVFCPVWYNSFLSEKQFRRFHWPYLKYICEGLIEAGSPHCCPSRGITTICSTLSWNCRRARASPGSSAPTWARPRKSWAGICAWPGASPRRC